MMRPGPPGSLRQWLWLGALALPAAAAPIQQHGPIDAAHTRPVLSAPAAVGGPRSERGNAGGPRFPLLPAGASNSVAPPRPAAPGNAAPAQAAAQPPPAPPSAGAGAAQAAAAAARAQASQVVRSAALTARAQRLLHAQPGPAPAAAAAPAAAPAPGPAPAPAPVQGGTPAPDSAAPQPQ